MSTLKTLSEEHNGLWPLANLDTTGSGADLKPVPFTAPGPVLFELLELTNRELDRLFFQAFLGYK